MRARLPVQVEEFYGPAEIKVSVFHKVPSFHFHPSCAHDWTQLFSIVYSFPVACDRLWIPGRHGHSALESRGCSTSVCRVGARPPAVISVILGSCNPQASAEVALNNSMSGFPKSYATEVCARVHCLFSPAFTPVKLGKTAIVSGNAGRCYVPSWS